MVIGRQETKQRSKNISEPPIDCDDTNLHFGFVFCHHGGGASPRLRLIDEPAHEEISHMLHKKKKKKNKKESAGRCKGFIRKVVCGEQ